MWAIGLIAFRLLTARPYWLAANHPNVDRDALLAELAGGARVSASQRARELRARSVPAGFDAWFARCLRPDPEQRFANAREAVDALRPALDAPGIPLAATAPMQATPRPEPVAPFAQPAPPKPAPRDSGLTTAVMALGAIFVAAIAVTGLWALNQDWSDESDLPPPPPAPLAQPAWPPPPIPAQAEVASPPARPDRGAAGRGRAGPDAERTPTGLASRVIEAGTGLVHLAPARACASTTPAGPPTERCSTPRTRATTTRRSGCTR
ncbi:MAG: hypothetical protein H6719_33825 [Sandaracinaceae bacterium]|nr:hypothetical protein [Sandaracinaceae bacterium]